MKLPLAGLEGGRDGDRVPADRAEIPQRAAGPRVERRSNRSVGREPDQLVRRGNESPLRSPGVGGLANPQRDWALMCWGPLFVEGLPGLGPVHLEVPQLGIGDLQSFAALLNGKQCAMRFTLGVVG